MDLFKALRGTFGHFVQRFKKVKRFRNDQRLSWHFYNPPNFIKLEKGSPFLKLEDIKWTNGLLENKSRHIPTKWNKYSKSMKFPKMVNYSKILV